MIDENLENIRVIKRWFKEFKSIWELRLEKPDEILSQFIRPMPGMPQLQIETNACEGGSFTIIMQVGDDKIPHAGKYLEISCPHKLIFTRESPFSVDDSIVTFQRGKLKENETNVELIHVRFIDEESRSNHQGGRDNILDKLNDIMC